MRWFSLLVVAVGMVACGNSDSDPTDTGGATCDQRSGTFVVTYTADSGNCGAIPQSTAVLDAQPTTATAPCTGALSYSADNCMVTLQQSCPVDAVGSNVKTITEAGDAHWSVDGTTGTATLEITGLDASGALLCSGEYTVAYAKN